MSTIHNLHVPLPDDLYRQLREETRRQRKPATQLARQAIEQWLQQQQQSALQEAIRTYAERESGTEADLDPLLEAAAIEFLTLEKPPE